MASLSSKKELSRIIYIDTFIILISILIPAMIGIGAGIFVGAGINFVKFTLYGIVGLATLFFLTAFKFMPKTSFLKTVLHEPEAGLINFAKFGFVKNGFLFGLISFTTFSFVALLSGLQEIYLNFDRTQYTAIESSNIILSSEPSGWGEIGVCCIIFALFHSIGLKASNNKKNSTIYYTIMGIGAIVNGIIAIGYHFFRYANSHDALLSVFVFFTMGFILMTIFNSFIIFWMSKVAFNYIGALFSTFGNFTAIVYGMMTVTLMIVFTASLIWLFMALDKKFKIGVLGV